MAFGAILGQTVDAFTKTQTYSSGTQALYPSGTDTPDDVLALLSKAALYKTVGQAAGLYDVSDNLLLKLPGVQIATGSYVGTDKYGPDNPNSLTFDFEPKFVLIFSGGDNNSVYFGFAFLTSEGGYSYKPAGSNGQWFYVGKITPSFGTNKVTWSSGSAETQMNTLFSYYYFAIG